jgi:hypothetical protein
MHTSGTNISDTGDWPWIDFCHQYLVYPLVPIGETVGAMSELVRTGSLKE